MAVRADEGAVKADVHGGESGHGAQLGGDEVLLHDAILPVQQLQNGDLHPVAALVVGQGAAAHQQIQALSGDGLPQGLAGLFGPQVRQQVVDGEQGVPLPVADGYPDGLAALQGHHAVEFQGDGHPLILADAAVVVGLEEGQLVALIEGVLLQVQTGGVDVGRTDVHALAKAPAADDRQHDGLAPVHLIELVPRLYRHAPDKGLEARGLGHGYGALHALPLRLAVVQKLLIALAVGIHGLQLAGGQTVIAVLLLIGQGLAQGLAPAGLLVLVHNETPPYSSFVSVPGPLTGPCVPVRCAPAGPGPWPRTPPPWRSR